MLTSIKEIKSLKNLYFKDNNISELHDLILELSNLKFIELGGNPLTKDNPIINVLKKRKIIVNI